MMKSFRCSRVCFTCKFKGRVQNEVKKKKSRLTFHEIKLVILIIFVVHGLGLSTLIIFFKKRNKATIYTMDFKEHEEPCQRCGVVIPRNKNLCDECDEHLNPKTVNSANLPLFACTSCKTFDCPNYLAYGRDCVGRSPLDNLKCSCCGYACVNLLTYAFDCAGVTAKTLALREDGAAHDQEARKGERTRIHEEVVHG